MTKKILLADDSITIQKVVRITLADGDYNLITVDNGVEAMDKARSEMPDLVLADVVMPGKDGYQVCDEIKKSPALGHIPVILLAGSFEGFDEIKGAEVGADGYIIKPFESQTLIGKVEEMLSRPRQKAQAGEARPAAKPSAAASQPAKPAASPHIDIDSEVKDFMDTLSAEMDQPAKETEIPRKPAAGSGAQAGPGREAQQVWAEAEAALEEPMPEVQESDQRLWEAEPIEQSQVGAGEAVMEGEAVSEEELWAEPIAEGAGPEGEPVMEAVAVEDSRPGAEQKAAGPGSFVQPVAESVFVEEPVMSAEGGEAAALEESYPGLGREAPSAAVQAKVAEAAEEIATAAASGLKREELVELIRATVERVAWEVVPEMAEALIKERITRWEVQTQ